MKGVVMRAATLAILILLLPAALLAVPTMGVYFHNGGQMTYSPVQFEQFEAYVYEHNAQCYLDAAEFEICYPPGIVQIGFEIPVGSLSLGDPDTGVSITYWPPRDGWNPGYNLLCTLKLMAVDFCHSEGGGMADAHIVIVPDHAVDHIYGSCWPDNYLFDYVGLTSIFCPTCIGTESKSWGAIKSLF
jgi:hypothetical protein